MPDLELWLSLWPLRASDYVAALLLLLLSVTRRCFPPGALDLLRLFEDLPFGSCLPGGGIAQWVNTVNVTLVPNDFALAPIVQAPFVLLAA